MMKKTAAILLALTVFLCSSAFAQIPCRMDENASVSAPYGLLEELGIVFQDEYKTLDFDVTKGMFLKWVIRMTAMTDNLIPKASKNIFLDLSMENPYADWAEYGYNRGIVKGDEHGRFSAESGISVYDAATMAARAAGYNIDESLLIKARSKAMRGMNSNDMLTSAKAMEIIFNTLSLDAVMFGNDGYYTNDNRTILNELFGVYEYSGIIDDDSLININEGASKLGSGKVSFGGKVYAAESGRWCGYAGYNAKVYIKEIEGEDKIIFITPDNNTVKNLKIRDISSYKNGSITMDDNKKYKVSDTAKNIMNFERIYVSDEFSLPNDGTLVTIDNNSDGAIDCLFIYVPQYGVITEINQKNETLYLKEEKNLSLELDKYESFSLLDYDGGEISLGDIKPGFLAECYAAGDYSQIVIFADKKEAEYNVASVAESGGETYVKTTDGEKICLSPHFEFLSDISYLSPGKSYSVTLDSDGRIAAAKEMETDALAYGYLFSFGSDSAFNTDIKLAIYSAGGQMITAKTKNKIRLSENGSERTVTAERLLTDFKSGFEPSLVRFGINSEGEIYKLEFPSKDKFADGFRCVGTSGGAASGAARYDSRMRLGKIGMIGGQILLDIKNTKCIIVPADLKTDGEWAVLSVSDALLDGKYYQALKGYGKENGNMTADVVVIPRDKLAESYKDDTFLRPALVSEFGTAYDFKSGESYKTVVAYQNDSKVTFRLDDDVPLSYTLSTTGETIDIEPGDIIRPSVDYRNRMVSFKLLFDKSSERSFGINDSESDQFDYGYGYSQRTNYGTPYKIVGNAMYIVKKGESEPSGDIFRTDIGTIYEYNPDNKEPIRIITANDIETQSNNPSTTEKVYIQLYYSENLITVVYK